MKISLVEGPRRRRLIVDGKLIARWVAEFAAVCEKARPTRPGKAWQEVTHPRKTRMGQNGLRVETATVNVDTFDSFDKFAILAGSYRFTPKRQFESRGFCTSLSGSNLYVCAAVARASSAAARAFSSAARVTRCSWILIMLSASLEVAMPCGKRQPHSARLRPHVRLSQHCELRAGRGVSSRQVDGSRSALTIFSSVQTPEVVEHNVVARALQGEIWFGCHYHGASW